MSASTKFVLLRSLGIGVSGATGSFLIVLFFVHTQAVLGFLQVAVFFSSFISGLILQKGFKTKKPAILTLTSPLLATPVLLIAMTSYAQISAYGSFGIAILGSLTMILSMILALPVTFPVLALLFIWLRYLNKIESKLSS